MFPPLFRPLGSLVERQDPGSQKALVAETQGLDLVAGNARPGTPLQETQGLEHLQQTQDLDGSLAAVPGVDLYFSAMF